MTLERVLSASGGRWRKKIKGFFQTLSTGINLRKVKKRRKKFMKSHFPQVNTGTKGLKMALYFLRQRPSLAESTRSKFEILKNEVDFGA